MKHLIYWPDCGYLIEEWEWRQAKYSWTPNKKDATTFRSEAEALSAYDASGAGSRDRVLALQVSRP